jgi:DNA-binding response OmpR family regulator
MPKILIVEDDRVVSETLADALRDGGFEVSGIASSGRKSLELARENPPDVVLMDVRLEGDLNGIETAIFLQGYFERAVPVIFVTAFPATDYPYLKIVSHFHYINKPFTPDEVLARIRKCLGEEPSIK